MDCHTKKISKYRNIKVGLGLHPELANEKFNEIDMLIKYIPESDFIGEVGIDCSVRYSESMKKQELIFKKVLIECQKCGGRIISIHSRYAVSRILAMLKKYPDCGRPILHWFSGSISELKQAIEMNCFFSINPAMLKSKKGKELTRNIPINLILPESDGPFVKIEDKIIMPWEAVTIYSSLSKIFGGGPNRLMAPVCLFNNR